MPRILRTVPARRDYVQIWVHIAEDNIDAADDLVRKFDHALDLLADNPGLGPERPELAPGMRSFPVGKYLLFYRPLDKGIELLRVLHGARDLKRIFKPKRRPPKRR